MAAKSFYLKCFLVAKLQGVRNGPAFSCDNILLCEMQNRKLDYLFTRSLCSQILNAPADIFSMCIGKQELPDFYFFLPRKKKTLRREKVGEEQNTMGVGWDADKVDYGVFPSYLPSTRHAMVIKSVLLFCS